MLEFAATARSTIAGHFFGALNFRDEERINMRSLAAGQTGVENRILRTNWVLMALSITRYICKLDLEHPLLVVLYSTNCWFENFLAFWDLLRETRREFLTRAVRNEFNHRFCYQSSAVRPFWFVIRHRQATRNENFLASSGDKPPHSFLLGIWSEPFLFFAAIIRIFRGNAERDFSIVLFSPLWRMNIAIRKRRFLLLRRLAFFPLYSSTFDLIHHESCDSRLEKLENIDFVCRIFFPHDAIQPAIGIILASIKPLRIEFGERERDPPRIHAKFLVQFGSQIFLKHRCHVSRL